MLLDITLQVTPEMRQSAPEKDNQALAGHIGTHFDIMDKEFPIDYICCQGLVFDVSAVRDRDIGLGDIDMDAVQADMFVAFNTGYIEEMPYGCPVYFAEHTQLSHELINALPEKGISIIGIDCSGIRRGKEHTPKDQYRANRGVFVIENLCGLQAVVQNGVHFTAHTYPVNYSGMTGLPCRVIAEV